MKKGPQTIEKAKQGSYVARSVSSLQKIRLRGGQSHGFIELADGKFRIESYLQLQREIIDTPSSSVYPGFVLTVGIVSNHGNWYSSENPNKELRVLAQSYDWLLFLTDQGLLKFINDFLLNPSSDLKPAQKAFRKSYPRQGNAANRFTKVHIDVDADRVLRRYFAQYKTRINSWFNVISPSDGTLDSLNADLGALASRIYSSG